MPTPTPTGASASTPVIYGQIVCGSPGSGKTTYCNGMQQYLTLLGRKVGVINLDPANELNVGKTEYLLDVCTDIVNLQNVMEELQLGPNGGLLYCMEYIDAHVDELVSLLHERMVVMDTDDYYYLIFDLPGQVEVYTHGTSVANLIAKLTTRLHLRLTCVSLVDSTSCWEAHKFLSAALLSTTAMLRLELPTVSVLTKVDLLVEEKDMPFSLEYFLECQDLDRLVDYLDGHHHEDYTSYDSNYMDDPDYIQARQKTRQSIFFRKHSKLHSLLSEVVNDFGLLSFVPLDINRADSVGRVLRYIDKANGYIFLSNNSNHATEELFRVAMQSETFGASSHYEAIADIKERFASC